VLNDTSAHKGHLVPYEGYIGVSDTKRLRYTAALLIKR